MLSLILNTIWSNPFLAFPLFIVIPLLPLSLLCFTKTSVSNKNNTANIWPIVGIGAGIYTIHRLHKIEKELRELKDK